MATTKSEAEARLAALISAQRLRPVEDPEQFGFRDWPEDESVEDFLAAVREWRREGSNLAECP
ncbi:MAG TPA: hypothetical protein VII06_22825 [Chloroflexota bacterium]